MSEDTFSIDFGDVQDLGPVPQGWYTASIVKATPGKSQSGEGKIDLQWRIEDGDQEGRIVFDMLSFHPNALPFTKAKLLLLGYDEGFSGAIDPDDLVGQTADVHVVIKPSTKIDPATGEPYPPRNQISRIKAQ